MRELTHLRKSVLKNCFSKKKKKNEILSFAATWTDLRDYMG